MEFVAGKNSRKLILFAAVLTFILLILIFVASDYIKQQAVSGIFNKTKASSFPLSLQQTNQTPSNAVIEQYECLNNSDCNVSAICINRSCVALTCQECQYIQNHSCSSYECCKDIDCNDGYICKDNKCERKNYTATEYNISFGILFQDHSSNPPTILSYDFLESVPSIVIMDYNHRQNSTLAFVIIRTKEEFDFINDNIIIFPDPEIKTFSDFENYFVMLIFGYEPTDDLSIWTDKITASENNVTTFFTRKSLERYMWGGAASLFKVKKSGLPETSSKDYSFIFRKSEDVAQKWAISDVKIN